MFVVFIAAMKSIRAQGMLVIAFAFAAFFGGVRD